MDSYVDNAAAAAEKTGELIEEGSGSPDEETRSAAAPLSMGAPTAEAYLDNMPIEWSRDETGAEPEPA
jgi:hypothetical protein